LTIEIKKYCDGKIKCSFGIGTFFTSDFKKISNKTKSKAMNMVIKLTKINDVSVVKLSDTPAKSIGDKKMVEIMKYIHFNN
jgi:nicotinate phosphoribosyltransferase